MILECSTNLKDKRFNGGVGRIFRARCPSCLSEKKPVYGSFIYHPLSSICKAATHAGSLIDNKGGYIMIEIVSGKKIYNGSIGHDGSNSATFAASPISFKTRQGTSPTEISCTDSPNKDPFANGRLGQKYVVICPKNCSSKIVSIFGSEVYTDTSAICVSAIHAGVLNDLGGEIEFLIDGPQTFYKGTKSFGVISKSENSYIRSFKFVGIKSAIFYNFKEDYKGKVYEKWDEHVSLNSKYTESNYWSYDDTFITVGGSKKKISYMKHKGKVTSTIDNGYASFLILKNAQWSSGRIKTNFNFNDKNTFALIFKYADINNYYALEFKPNSFNKNLNLVERNEGVIKIIETLTLKLTVSTLYSL